MKIILTIIIAIMQTLIVIIPLKGKLSDNRFKFPKNFTKLGWYLILFCFVTTSCTIIFFIITDSAEERNKLTLSTQLEERDSVHQQRIIEAGKMYTEKLDSSNKNTIDALAKYGLKYDTAQSKIEKLVSDSTKRNITIIQGNNPVFGICSEGIIMKEKRGDSLDFHFSFCHKYSPSNVNLSLHCIGVNGKRFILLAKIPEYLSIKNGLELDGSFENIFWVINRSTSSTIFFYLKGSYTKKDNSDLIPFDLVIGYDLTDNRYGFPSEMLSEDIKLFVSTIK